MPIIAIVDPDMMSSMPKGLTASTAVSYTHLLKKYKEEHFTFRFVYHSAKNPKEVLLDDTFKYL